MNPSLDKISDSAVLVILTPTLFSLQMFKGPNEDIEAIFTAPVSAVCGVTLDATGKKEYLISGLFELLFLLVYSQRNVPSVLLITLPINCLHYKTVCLCQAVDVQSFANLKEYLNILGNILMKNTDTVRIM